MALWCFAWGMVIMITIISRQTQVARHKVFSRSFPEKDDSPNDQPPFIPKHKSQDNQKGISKKRVYPTTKRNGVRANPAGILISVRMPGIHASKKRYMSVVINFHK
jgi:hypothetical protein